jgi:hypothetical protein
VATVTSTDDIGTLAELCRIELDKRGFIVVPGFLSKDEVAAGRESFARLAPTAEEVLAAGPDRFALLHDEPPHGSFGGRGMRQWPFYDDDVLVDQATSPKLVSLVRQILGVDELRLGPFALLFFAKYGGLGDYDQHFHMDRIGLVPVQRRGPRRTIRTWLYYNDITEECGPTCLLPFEVTKDIPITTVALMREEHPELYEREVAAVGPAGSVLIWTNPGVFHRGSALGDPPAYRWISGSDWQAAGCDWTGMSPLRPWRGDAHVQAVIKRFLARATVEQRTLFGFPAPTDLFWDELTVAAAGEEYPGMDLTPYHEALAAR